MTSTGDSDDVYSARPPQAMLSVVVPTRNEADSILPLLQRINAALDNMFYEVIVVDDSDDDTPNLVNREAEAGFPVRLIHREGGERAGGLGSAVSRGFGAARGTYLACLDADLQHPPEKLRDLVEALIRQRADIAVASRYVPGGASLGLDGPVRRLGSLGARMLGQLVVPKARLSSDPLGGFFVLSREVIEGIELRPLGFKILLEILARGRVNRVVDVPYVFQPRVAGQSKADFGQLKLYLGHLARLRFR